MHRLAPCPRRNRGDVVGVRLDGLGEPPREEVLPGGFTAPSGISRRAGIEPAPSSVIDPTGNASRRYRSLELVRFPAPEGILFSSWI